jgi:hypothetical protein
MVNVSGGNQGMRVKAARISTVLAVSFLVSGCAMDLGGWGSDEPTKLAAPAPQPQPQQQVATNPYGQPAQPQYQQPAVPPGQAAFAPAPKPGDGSFAATPAPAGRMLGEQELRQMLTGKTITVADGRRLEYGRSGSYQETRNGQPIAVGQYRIRDVSVCVQFTNGLSRCDSFVDNNGQLFVEDRNGTRLPAQRG